MRNHQRVDLELGLDLRLDALGVLALDLRSHPHPMAGLSTGELDGFDKGGIARGTQTSDQFIGPILAREDTDLNRPTGEIGRSWCGLTGIGRRQFDDGTGQTGYLPLRAETRGIGLGARGVRLERTRCKDRPEPLLSTSISAGTPALARSRTSDSALLRSA